MTNETQKQKKFVMIVDDLESNIETGRTAVKKAELICSPEYGVVDLQKAREILNGQSRAIAIGQSPNIVLTDLHFNEKGSDKYDEYISPQNEKIIEKKLRNSLLLRKLAVLFPRRWIDENRDIQIESEEFWINDTINSRDPPNGYFIAQECEKRNIPYAIVTSLGHGMGGLLLLAEDGIIPEEELFKRLEKYKMRLHEDNSIYGHIPNSRVVLTRSQKTERDWNDALNLALNYRRTETK